MSFAEGIKSLKTFFSGIDLLFWTGLIVFIILIIFFCVLIAQNGAKINDPDFADSKEYLKDQRTFFIVLLVFCSIALIALLIYKWTFAKKYKEIIQNEVEMAIAKNINEIAGQVAISANDVNASVGDIAEANFKAGLDVGVYYVLPKTLIKYNNGAGEGKKLSEEQIRNLVIISSKETFDVNRDKNLDDLTSSEFDKIPFEFYDRNGQVINPKTLSGYYTLQLNGVKNELELVKKNFTKATVEFIAPVSDISNRVPIDLAYKIAKSERFVEGVNCGKDDKVCIANKQFVLDTLKRTNDIQCKPCGLGDGFLRERKSFEYGSPEYKYKAVTSPFKQKFSNIGPQRVKVGSEETDYTRAFTKTRQELATSQNQISSLQKQLSDAEVLEFDSLNKISTANAELARVKSSGVASQKEVDTLTSKITTLENRYRDSQQVQAALRQGIRGLYSENIDLQKANANLQGQYNTSQEIENSLLQAGIDLTDKNIALEKNLNRVGSDLEQSLNTLNSLKQQRNYLRQQQELASFPVSYPPPLTENKIQELLPNCLSTSVPDIPCSELTDDRIRNLSDSNNMGCRSKAQLRRSEFILKCPDKINDFNRLLNLTIPSN